MYNKYEGSCFVVLIMNPIFHSLTILQSGYNIITYDSLLPAIHDVESNLIQLFNIHEKAVIDDDS